MSVNCFHASSKCSLTELTKSTELFLKLCLYHSEWILGAKNIKLHIKNMWAELRKIFEAATGGVL